MHIRGVVLGLMLAMQPCLCDVLFAQSFVRRNGRRDACAGCPVQAVGSAACRVGLVRSRPSVARSPCGFNGRSRRPATPLVMDAGSRMSEDDDGTPFPALPRKESLPEDSGAHDALTDAAEDLFSSSTQDGEIIVIGGQRFERRGRALVNIDAGEAHLRRADRAKSQAGRDPTRRFERDIVDFDVHDAPPVDEWGQSERRGRGQQSRRRKYGREEVGPMRGRVDGEPRPWVVKRASQTIRARPPGAGIQGLEEILVGRMPPPSPDGRGASGGAGRFGEAIDTWMGEGNAGGAASDDDSESSLGSESSGEEGADAVGGGRGGVWSRAGSESMGGAAADEGGESRAGEVGRLPELDVEAQLLLTQDGVGGGDEEGGRAVGEENTVGAGGGVGADDSVIKDYADAIEDGEEEEEGRVEGEEALDGERRGGGRRGVQAFRERRGVGGGEGGEGRYEGAEAGSLSQAPGVSISSQRRQSIDVVNV